MGRGWNEGQISESRAVAWSSKPGQVGASGRTQTLDAIVLAGTAVSAVLGEPGFECGDVAAFEELVNRYESKILRLTRNITGNREDAEDAMQGAFLKAYAHLDGFQQDSRFYTWLVRIAANQALMRLRKAAPRSILSMNRSKGTPI
jgi:Sigma-70 region 2